MQIEDGETTVVRWELPLSKLIPKALYEAQQHEIATVPDAELLSAAMPDAIDWRLRIRYNSLMQKFLDPTRPMDDKAMLMEDVCQGICSYDTLKRRLKIPAKAVFITRKLGSYLEDQDALLTAFSTRLWEIASAPILKKDGTVDIESAKILHKTIGILLDRKFGQAVQRQVTVGVQAPQTMDPIAIEAELAKLEAMSGQHGS